MWMKHVFNPYLILRFCVLALIHLPGLIWSVLDVNPSNSHHGRRIRPGNLVAQVRASSREAIECSERKEGG